MKPYFNLDDNPIFKYISRSVHDHLLHKDDSVSNVLDVMDINNVAHLCDKYDTPKIDGDYMNELHKYITDLEYFYGMVQSEFNFMDYMNVYLIMCYNIGIIPVNANLNVYLQPIEIDPRLITGAELCAYENFCIDIKEEHYITKETVL